MIYLEKLKESSEKKVKKARDLESKARKGKAPKGRAYKAAWKAADSISRGRVRGVANAVNSLITQRHSELEEARKKKGRCWTGYKPKPGSVPYSKGSCVKEAYKLIGLALIDEEEEPKNIKVTDRASADKFLDAKKRKYERETAAFYSSKPKPKRKDDHTSYQQIGDILDEAKVDKGLTRAQKMVAREMRKDDTPDPLAKKHRTKADRKRAIGKLKRDRENPGVARAATLATNRERAKSLKMQRLANKITGERDPNEKPEKLKTESYIQIGDILAEAILGKIRTKAADKLDKFSRNQYRKGEVDDASGKPKRAGLRGRAAHAAGKLAQKVRPKDKG